MRVFVVFGVILSLTACGGGNSRSGVGSTRGATGEISRACLAADRDAANTRLCGCVQSVANQTLSQSDRNRAASFFTNPERANDTKLSSTRADDAFWDRYRNFISTSREICS